MTNKQFLWGLSSGVFVLAIAGTFWFGLGVSSVLTSDTDWKLWCLSTIIQVGMLAGLIWFAYKLRRHSGFKSADFQNADEQLRNEARQIRAKFVWIVVGQTILIALGVWLFVSTNATDQIWPWIAFIVSVHFIPLARLFRVKAYYVTGITGSVLALVVFTGILKPYSQAYLGAGVAVVMWFSAVYIIRNTDKITSAAIRKT